MLLLLSVVKKNLASGKYAEKQDKKSVHGIFRKYLKYIDIFATKKSCVEHTKYYKYKFLN